MMIDFKRPDGSSCRGYLALAGQGRPGMVVIQEWWGLNAQICGIADRLAAAGYNALAPDLFKGRIAQDADEASHMMNGLDFSGATHEDIRGAVRHLLSLSPRVGVMGFCMGGALTIASAVHVPEVSAAVCFYGIPPRDFADPAQIRIPFQGHFARHDAWCTPALVNEISSAMTAAGNPPEIYEYDAEHAFFNQMRPEVYDAESSKLAWERTLTFLKHHL
ncbi:MAG: dienelactone hydrolase family protein [Betaproteobacteria bacterium]|nr:dienelactone hydrolase family protein [Betaproteobacteria bacterium]MDE2212533.1 dienelactone hydrolase family protein [Betaproteobacteria bacterium]